jgi:hypothetical protein
MLEEPGLHILKKLREAKKYKKYAECMTKVPLFASDSYIPSTNSKQKYITCENNKTCNTTVF